MLHSAMVLWIGLAIETHGAAADEPAAGASAALRLEDGDRVILVGATFLERDRHHGRIEEALRARFPGTKLSFRDLAWPGDTVAVQMRPLDFGSFESHLRAQRPTVVIVSYGMTEAFGGEKARDRFLADYRKLLDVIDKTEARVILIGPHRHEALGLPLPDPRRHNENLRLYSKAVAQLAVERERPFVDLFEQFELKETPPIAYPRTENGIHLSDFGYVEAAGVIAREVGLLAPTWRIDLDASGKVIDAAGVAVKEIERADRSLRFTAIASALPPDMPADAPPSGEWKRPEHVLSIAGLPPGDYALRIGGDEAVVASAARWQEGMSITRGPDFAQAARLRDAIRRKDRLFFDRWRAHNGEYIYGRRAKAGGNNSGNPAFTAEFARLDRLLEEADRQLDELSRPEPHQYELVPR
ncbi:MAG: SGNH/GDSL hydrolase family protein [Planctomycetaceae bacterium]